LKNATVDIVRYVAMCATILNRDTT